MQPQLKWHRYIREQAPNCPSCSAWDWVPNGLGPLTYLGDGPLVLQVTCKYCGHVASYSAKHLADACIWV